MRETEREEVWMGRRRPRSSSGVLAEEAKGGDDKAVMGESREHWSVGRSEYGRGKSRKDDEMRTSQSVEEQVQRCFQTKAAIVRTTLLKPLFSRSVMPMRRRPRSVHSERGIAEAVTQDVPNVTSSRTLPSLPLHPPLQNHARLDRPTGREPLQGFASVSSADLNSSRG